MDSKGENFQAVKYTFLKQTANYPTTKPRKAFPCYLFLIQVAFVVLFYFFVRYSSTPPGHKYDQPDYSSKLTHSLINL